MYNYQLVFFCSPPLHPLLTLLPLRPLFPRGQIPQPSEDVQALEQVLRAVAASAR